MFDLENPYDMTLININNENDITYVTDSISGVNLAYEHLILDMDLFNTFIGGEFMLGRESVSRMAFHSIYAMPALSFKNKLLLYMRLGLTQLNTDNPNFLFKWNGLLGSLGIEYQVTDKMSLGLSYTSYDMNDEQYQGDKLDLTYNKIGVSMIYGLAIVDKKERNEKK